MTQTQNSPTRWQEQRLNVGATQREAALEDMRQKMHQFVIHELGPLLTDQRISEAELRRQVDEQLLRALSQERLALTVAERQVLVQSVTDDVLGYGPIDLVSESAGIASFHVRELPASPWMRTTASPWPARRPAWTRPCASPRFGTPSRFRLRRGASPVVRRVPTRHRPGRRRGGARDRSPAGPAHAAHSS